MPSATALRASATSTFYGVGERVVAGSGDGLDVGEVVATCPDGYVVAWSNGERTVDDLADAVPVSRLAPLVEVVRAAGEFASGGNVEAAAGRWWQSGFSASEASEWLAVRCFDAVVARRLADRSVCPSDVAEPVEASPESETVGYAVANGDMSVESVMRVLGQGEP